MEFDYIVAGAGAAGCVVAGRLARAGMTVCLIEAGPPDRNPLIPIPGANVVTGTHPAINWAFQSEPEPHLNGRSLYWAQGRVLGGSGSINGMMYARGQPENYDAWVAAGAEGWDYTSVLRAYRKAETNERGESDLHGGSGPLQVSKGVPTAPVCDMFLEAAAGAGIPTSDDLSRPARESFGHWDQTLSKGRRSSTARAYLRDRKVTSLVTIMTDTMAEKVLFTGQRAVGLRVRGRTGVQDLRARREVVLSGGAVNSPTLLLQSGIGPADELRALGIDVVCDLPQVGRHLQNHTSYKFLFKTNAPVTAYSALSPKGAVTAGLSYAFGRKGILSRGLFPTGGTFRVGDAAHEAMQICMAPALVIRRKPGVLRVLPQEHGFTLLMNQGIPRSQGSIRLRSADPRVRPMILGNHLADPADADVLIKGTARIREIMAQPAMAKVLGDEIRQGPAPRTRAEWQEELANSINAHYHPGGSCRIGPAGVGVVSPELRVHGVDGLRVIDASVMPLLVNGNTYAPTIMIAERGAEFLLAAAV